MSTPGSRLRGALVAAAGLVCVDARLAFAQQQGDQQQQGIQEVIVTAERRSENLQTTPIAITALSAEQLNKANISDFAGAAEATTSLNFTPYPSSSNTLILYMRGQGVADANQITQDGSVGLYEDGFYISRPQAETFDLADVDRVEVLRGPQGTLYGRNTTGGAVNIISKKPTGELDFKIDLQGGNRDYVRALGTINLPKVLDGLSSKLTLYYSNRAGNVSNSGGEDYNKEAQRGARAQLRWDNGGIFTADYFWEWGKIDSTPIYYQDSALYPAIPGYPPTYGLAGNTWTPIYLPPSIAEFNANGLTLNFKLSDTTTLRSLTYYRYLDTRFYQDYAGGFTNPAVAPVEGITNFTGADIVQSNEFTQELQLIGDIGPSINYVAGLYYFDESANHLENGAINIPKEFVPGIPIFTETTYRYVTAQAKSKAAYLQFTWKITEPLSLTLGGRYTKDTRDATRTATTNALAFVPFPPFQFPINSSETGASNSLSFSKFNPAGTLNMAWTPDVNTYLRIATGYKAGGSSEAGPIGSFGQTFKPENVTTYELGLKSFWLERRLRANIALFHSDFKDMQLQFDVDPTNLAIVQSYNAGSAKVNGAEVELLFAPTRDFSLGLNYTFLDGSMDTVTAVAGTIFDPAKNPASPYQVGQNIAPLFRLPYAPRNIWYLTSDWTMLHTSGGSLELALDYRYQDRQYDTVTTGLGVPGSSEFYSIPPYGVLGGKLIWNFDMPGNKTMRFAIWGRNILDRQYPEHVIGQGAAPLVALPNSSPPPAVIPQTGYTYQAVAWAPKPLFGAEFSYGF